MFGRSCVHGCRLWELQCPSNGIVVDERPVMGVKSQGMLCSAFNIGWLESEAGVLVELPQGSTLGERCPENPPKVS